MIWQKFTKLTIRKNSNWPGLILYLLLAFVPVLYLSATGGKDHLPVFCDFSERRAGLLYHSVIIAFFTAVCCVSVGLFAAVKLHSKKRGNTLGRWFFLLTAPVPSYIYALTYMNLVRMMGRFIPSLLRYRMAGIWPCVIVEGFAFLPYACAAAMISLEQVDAGEWKAALLCRSADRVYWRIVFPKQLPYLMAIGAVIFVLSITDYTIPSLFQVNVYAMEIFSDYSAVGRSAHSLELSVPLLFVSAAVILMGILPLRNVVKPMKDDEEVIPQYSRLMNVAGSGAVLVAVLQIILPVFSLIPYVGSLSGSYVSAGEELWNSGITGLGAVAFVMIPSAMMALQLAEQKTMKPVWLGIAIAPLSIPGVLTGIGVLKFFSDTPLHVLRSGNIMPSIGMAIRYLPFAMLIQYGCYLRMDRNRIDAARLLQPGRGQAFWRVKVFMMMPGMAIAGLVVFLLTLGDVGTALMLMPAGKEPLSVKIYNYLHYGASETVAVFCLMQMAVCLAAVGVLYFGTWIWQKIHKR